MIFSEVEWGGGHCELILTLSYYFSKKDKKHTNKNPKLLPQAKVQEDIVYMQGKELEKRNINTQEIKNST